MHPVIRYNAFHTFKVLWENEYFLIHNLFCSFTSVKLCPLIILLTLILKIIRINIFIAFLHLKHVYLIPLNRHVSSAGGTHSIVIDCIHNFAIAFPLCDTVYDIIKNHNMGPTIIIVDKL